MSTVEEIKRAIGKLPPGEKARLIEWLYAQELASSPEIMAGIAQGEADLRDGRVVSQAEARERLAKWLK